MFFDKIFPKKSTYNELETYACDFINTTQYSRIFVFYLQFIRFIVLYKNSRKYGDKITKEKESW